MTVFKTAFKIVKKYKFVILFYTLLLVLFAGVNLQSSDKTTNFVSVKPDVLIINEDENLGIVECLIDYISKNTNIRDIDNDYEKISDALFYRDISYVIYIKKGFRNELLNGENPNIEIKSSMNYQSYVVERLLSKFIKTANLYISKLDNEEDIIKYTSNVLSNDVSVKIASKLDTNTLSKVTFYFNFLNYSILAGCVYVISLILFCFRQEKIRKRTIISSTSYGSVSRHLFYANFIVSICLWLFYILLSFILLGDIMFSAHGLIYILNSFIFNLMALTIAFLLGNIINNKDSINGIINVISLGSSFLCGAFVPMEFLPSSVVSVAHILPSYWYIKNNELIKNIEVINFSNLKDIFINMGVIILFIILLLILFNIFSKRKQKIG